MRLAFMCAMALASSCIRAAELPEILTTSGSIRGTTIDHIQRFLNIPYAKAPIGMLRWRAPQPMDSWSGVRDGSHFGASCPQGPASAFGPYTQEFLERPEISEDCLSLNIWAPVKDARLRPVYVFIHGGGFIGGAGAVPIYDGTGLATRGVVVVTINYRLGVFGYLAHPELSRESSGGSGNFGIQDMIAALRWIHSNIGSFGGDPSLVTIAGQSAGAVAVNLLTQAPDAKGLFQRGVVESDPYLGGEILTLRDAESRGEAFMREAHATSIEQMRRLPVDELLRMTSFRMPPAGAPPSAPPVLRFVPNIDGVVVSAAPLGRIGVLSRVPLIVGFNSDEGQLFGRVADSKSDFVADVRALFGEDADRALALYPHENDAAAAEAAVTMARDRYMTALVLFAQARAAAGQTIFAYKFDHAYPVPGSERYRAFHTAEVPYIFGSLKQKDRVFTASDFRVSESIQREWKAFMLDGNPSSGRWQAATASTDTVAILRDSTTIGAAVSSPERLAFLKQWASNGHSLVMH